MQTPDSQGWEEQNSLDRALDSLKALKAMAAKAIAERSCSLMPWLLVTFIEMLAASRALNIQLDGLHWSQATGPQALLTSAFSFPICRQ